MRQPRYPVYVPSKGRAHTPLTVKFMQRDRLPYRLVVEPQEADRYAGLVGSTGQLLVLPESDQGLLYARNWIRTHAEAEGHERHWQIDDNIDTLYRLHHRRRIPCQAGPALAVVEDFSDRYTNIGIAGLNYEMFVPVETTRQPPLVFNVHVYSCTLISHAMPCRWRCLYNDDTDLCLQALAAGWCTVLMNVFVAKKRATMTVRGGNTDDLYQGDGRLVMARSLERLWPGVVRVERKYGRPQHIINWQRFRGAPAPQLREGLTLEGLAAGPADDYGLHLEPVREVKAKRLQQLVAQDQARHRAVRSQS